ncbi:MAG: AAA family ATPase [Clostridium sp.]|nr:AAA family ATPase [Clostridium sp.]
MKRFNTTGLCNPKKHYMVDISEKIEKIKVLIENEEYFVINRPRQYGKTTTLFCLRKELLKKYLVISISFEGIGDIIFNDEKLFCQTFLKNCAKAIRLIDKDNSNKLLKYSKEVTNLDSLSDCISEFIEESNKEIILIIDEVDKSSNNQLFLNFLGMLRNKYLEREKEEEVTFKSVILAGVYDIKNLKLKLRPDEERKYNSPWNIAVPFNINMSLSKPGIKNMLQEYKKDKDIELDLDKVVDFIYFYTSGYPFLVSRICQIIDEDLKASWNEENMIKAVKLLLNEENTLFDDLIKNIENNKNLKDYVLDIIMNGARNTFNIFNPTINLGVMFGYFKNEDNMVAISNRIFSQVLYNYFSSLLENNDTMKKYNFKSDFIEGNGLNIKKILLRFQQFMKEEYSSKNERFLETHGRMLFLSFLTPIINGIGFAFKEVQISEEKRLDVVITYNSNKYIIELKVWHGEEYHEKGLKQLVDYLNINNQNKGYLLIFNFNKNKEYKKEEVIVEGKEIFEVFV